MKFKTNARCAGCQAAITDALTSLAPASEWEIDLSSPEKILTYTGTATIDPEQVMARVRETGFKIEPLDD